MRKFEFKISTRLPLPIELMPDVGTKAALFIRISTAKGESCDSILDNSIQVKNLPPTMLISIGFEIEIYLD